MSRFRGRLAQRNRSATGKGGAGPSPPVLLPQHTRYIWTGNSRDAAGGFKDAHTQFLQMMDGRLYRSPLSKMAAGGYTAQDYAGANQIALMIAEAKGALVWIGDSTNGVSVPYLTQLDYYRTLAQAVISAGAAMVVIDLTPQNISMDSGSWTNIQNLNAAIILMSAEPGWNGKLKYCDKRSIEMIRKVITTSGSPTFTLGAFGSMPEVGDPIGNGVSTGPFNSSNGYIVASVGLDGPNTFRCNTTAGVAVNANATGTFTVSGYHTYEGRHWTARGAKANAQLQYNLASTLVDMSPAFSASEPPANENFGPNLNQFFALVDSNADGIPDGYTVSGANGVTFTGTFVTEGGKRKWALLASGTNTNAGVSTSITRTQTGLSLNPGDVVEVIIPFEITNAAETGRPTGINALQLQISSSPTAASVFNISSSLTDGPPQVLKGIVRFSGVLTPSNGQNTITSLAVSISMRFAVGSTPDCKVKLGEGLFLRKCALKSVHAPVDMTVTFNRPSDGVSTQFFTGAVASDVSGTVQVLITGTNGAQMSGDGLSLAFQWERDTGSGYSDIAGATSRCYPRVGVAGTYRCKIAYSNGDGSATITSSAVTI